MATKSVETKTRHQRVKDLLNEAAGESTADYDGLGRFWELPVPDLLTASVGGVRLIAPEKVESASCCSSHAVPDGNAAHGKSRGERSGLIHGLRAQAPFDGSRLPRLPWGGRAVAPADIQFISAWIDDGCPEHGGETQFQVTGLEAETTLVEVGREALPEDLRLGEAARTEAYEGAAKSYTYLPGELQQRMNLDFIGPEGLEKLRFAFRELYKLNKWPEDIRSYNNLAMIHQNHCQHGWERFLPWHRIYMYEFEQALQDVCPGVTLPYWDWTMSAYRPERPQDGIRIPKSFQLFLTEDSLAFLRTSDPRIPEEELAKLETLAKEREPFPSLRRFFDRLTGKGGLGLPSEYTTGLYRNRFLDALLASNALWYPLRYPGEYPPAKDGQDPQTINQWNHYHYPTRNDIEQILSLRTFRDFGGGSGYNDAFGFLDQNPHNTMHIWTGGVNPDFEEATASPEDRNRAVRLAGRKFHTTVDMYGQPQYGDMLSNLTASYDPVFWPVHSNVDRLWSEWQQAHPHSQPADLDSVLTPWSYTVRDTLDMHRFGYEYVKCAFMIPIGQQAPVGRFVSKPIEVSQGVLASFERAEVRLHRVPQLPRSCFIRVFLNCPDANANTPPDDEHFAGYLAVFGHGQCYGGPGHCDIPDPNRRKFDLRPRSHNTPRNHRVDVTACAKTLAAAGATSFQLTLVVVGADYREDNELLRLEGVSLNFLD